MLRMPLPILRVVLGQFLVMDHKKILRIILLCRLGKIEGPSDNGLPVDDHDLVVGDGVLGIYPGWNT